MADIQEVKAHLMNVYNTMNFLKKIGVPVGPYNKNIKNIMVLMKKDDISTAKKEVLVLRKETGDVLTRMDNIHNGLLQIDKEIARMVKKGKSTVALRRLYSQCRLALKDKDYDQVQLFIIKMDKIIDMYYFLEGSTFLVDIRKGEEIEEIIIKMELDAMKRRNAPREEKLIEPPRGRYVEEDEDLPVLTPLYENLEGTGPGEKELEGAKSSPADTRGSELSPEEKETGRETLTKAPERGNEQKTLALSEEVHKKISKLKEMIEDEDIIDGDMVRALQVSERLEKSGDWVGATELADELEKLLIAHIQQRRLASLTRSYREARKALLEVSKKIGDQKEIRILYNRATALRDSGDLEVSARLFTEVVSLCKESEIASQREIWREKMNGLKEKIDRIPSHLIERTSILGRLNSILVMSEGDDVSDIDALLDPVENDVETAYSNYRKEELMEIDEILTSKIETSSIRDIRAEGIRRLLVKARAYGSNDELDKAEKMYGSGMKEIESIIKTADCEKELRAFLMDLQYYHGEEENKMQMERYIEECKNRIIQKDVANFLILFHKAKEIAQGEIDRNKSISNLKLLDQRILELPEGELQGSFRKRYLEAKSKIDEGKYPASLELASAVLNEITIKALEEIQS